MCVQTITFSYSICITGDIIPIWDLDIPIIIEYENIDLSIFPDKVEHPSAADYTCTTKAFPDNKTSNNEFSIHNSNLDPNASSFNPHSSKILIEKTSNLTNENNNDIYSMLNEIRVKIFIGLLLVISTSIVLGINLMLYLI